MCVVPMYTNSNNMIELSVGCLLLSVLVVFHTDTDREQGSYPNQAEPSPFYRLCFITPSLCTPTLFALVSTAAIHGRLVLFRRLRRKG